MTTPESAKAPKPAPAKVYTPETAKAPSSAPSSAPAKSSFPAPLVLLLCTQPVLGS